MTRASVLIPIHDKPTTLPLTVDTVLRQHVTDLEVLLIGDGVTTEVRSVVDELLDRDRRIRFLDFPKGPHHGERYRHDAIMAADSDAIFYLCDDDLLLPDHVGDLLDLLAHHDLVQCLNGWVTETGHVRLYAADLADPDVVALHVREDLRFNSVSITGTAHTRAAYERVSRWDTTPDGQWPDHWQFRKIMGLPDFRGATSSRMTALQFPTSADGRHLWTAAARSAELERWHAVVAGAGAQARVDQLVRAGARAQLIEQRAEISILLRDLAAAREDLHAARLRAERNMDAARTEHDRVTAQLRGELDDLWRHVERLVEIRAEQQARIERLRVRVQAKNEVLARLRARRR